MSTQVQHNVTELLMDSATLMLVGMTFVFIFLGLMIASVKLIGFYCQQFPGDNQTEHKQACQPAKPAHNDHAIPPATIAAITAAVHQYRNSQ